MSGQDYIALAIAGAALFVVIRTLYRQASSGGCGSGCGCDQPSRAKSGAVGAADATDRLGITRHPFVPIGQLGLPEKGLADPKRPSVAP